METSSDIVVCLFLCLLQLFEMVKQHLNIACCNSNTLSWNAVLLSPWTSFSSSALDWTGGELVSRPNGTSC